MVDLFTFNNIAEKLFPKANSSDEKELNSDARLKKGFQNFYNSVLDSQGSLAVIIKYFAYDLGDSDNCHGFGAERKQTLRWQAQTYAGKVSENFISINEERTGVLVSFDDLYRYTRKLLTESDGESKAWSSSENIYLPKESFNFDTSIQPIPFPNFLEFMGYSLKREGALASINEEHIPNINVKTIPNWITFVPESRFGSLPIYVPPVASKWDSVFDKAIVNKYGLNR